MSTDKIGLVRRSGRSSDDDVHVTVEVVVPVPKGHRNPLGFLTTVSQELIERLSAANSMMITKVVDCVLPLGAFTPSVPITADPRSLGTVRIDCAPPDFETIFGVLAEYGWWFRIRSDETASIGEE
jgi:hypothetical protein